jgi:iron-sulfur cluster assembly protein
MISLTESALKHLQELVRSQEDATKGLRLSVEKGGCAGLEYAMKLDHTQEGDDVLEQDGVKVMIDPESIGYLRGSTIDYCDDLTGTGFRIQNPNAVRSCGCGSSFETEPTPAAEGQA